MHIICFDSRSFWFFVVMKYFCHSEREKKKKKRFERCCTSKGAKTPGKDNTDKSEAADS